MHCMVLECFRSAGSEACAITLCDTIGEEDFRWHFQLESPAQLVLAFLNGEYDSLLAEDEQQRAFQQTYLRESFGRESLRLVRGMICHVLLCTQEQGFDPVLRLAAYTFAEGMFEIARLTRYTEKATLETSVIGAEAMAGMTAKWGQMLAAHEAVTPPASREGLFEALLADAAEAGYPFELSFCQEYASFAHLLKAFAVEMIRRRVLLKRCLRCGRYFLAAESAEGYCAHPSPGNAEISCREEAGVRAPAQPNLNDEIAKLYKQIYNIKANRAKRSGEARLEKELEDFMAQAKAWRLRIRGGSARAQEYLDWLSEARGA
jgi:hypothetical protein